MVPLQKNIQNIREMLSSINPIEYDLDLWKGSDAFKSILEICFQTNEVIGINLETDGENFYCLPMLCGGKLTFALCEDMWGSQVMNVYSKLLASERQEIRFGLRKYWELQDFVELEQLETLNNPLVMIRRAHMVANRVLARSPKQLGIVCGPISTGLYSPEENLKVFNRVMYKVGQKMDMFNQLPFEALFAKIHELLHTEEYKQLLVDGKSSLFFINEFYRPIFGKQIKWTPHFIYGWELSVGATEEHDIFKFMEAHIVYLEKGYDNLSVGV